MESPEKKENAKTLKKRVIQILGDVNNSLNMLLSLLKMFQMPYITEI